MRRLLPLLLFLAAPALGAGTDKTVQFTHVQKGERTYFYAANTDPYAPYHIRMEFPVLVNLKFSGTLPVSQVIQPKQKVALGYIERIDRTQASSSNVREDYRLGDPDAIPDPQALYLLPYGHGVKHRVDQGYFGAFTHQTYRSLDFDLKEGSPICAAREGRVVRLKQDSNTGGPSAEFGPYANYIYILHKDGTWADYAHLQKNGAKVRLGQWVKAGQVIGLSGHTGQAKGPHLHFDIRQATWTGPETTVATLFQTQAGAVSLEEGHYYYGFHPGQPAFKEIHADSITEAQLEAYSAKAARNNTVKIRNEQVDNKTFVYCANGTTQDQQVTLRAPILAGMTSSKPLPLIKRIPALTEVYMVTLERVPSQSSQFQLGYQWVPAGP